jgi:polygalacturonase
MVNNAPMFPLNTDGIDPAGSNIIIRNVTITNYDDAVAVKPADGSYKVAKCSENILVENLKVYAGVGMTIGSVPPNEFHTCVKNVTFKNIDFFNAIKAVYVKTNPGEVGTGEITDITYENINVYGSLWWAVYIGPQ